MNLFLLLQEEVQLTSATIDLITGIVLIPLLFVFYKIETTDLKLKRMWLFFFLCLSIGDILGFVFHFFVIDEFICDLIWIPLYFMMYEIAKIFTKLAFRYFNKPLSKKNEMIFDIVSFIFLITSCVYQFFSVNEIRLFVIFAIAIDLPSFGLFIYLAFKKKLQLGYYMLIAMIPQLIGFPFQLAKKGGFHLIFDFDHNGIYHTCLLISIIIFFIGAYKDLINKKEGIENESICS